MLFELAKRIGFYDELTRTIRDADGKIEWPEAATHEIANIIKTIGMTGWTPERLKRHQENWDKFDEVTSLGKLALLLKANTTDFHGHAGQKITRVAQYFMIHINQFAKAEWALETALV